MAEIRVAPQRRNKVGLVAGLLVLALVALALWYFLAGPGRAVTGG